MACTAACACSSFSNTRGLCIGYAGPEAADGGPIAALRDGDVIDIDARPSARRIAVELTADQIARLDAASAMEAPYPYYPYWRGQFSERSPLPVQAFPPFAGAAP